MVHVPILLVSLMWGGVHALSMQPEQAVGSSESFIHTVDLAQLARDTVRFCYTPHKHPEECKTYVFVSTFSDTWQKTRDYCISLGGVVGVPMDSVAIESKEENELIKNHIETNYPTLNWWTSGSGNNSAEVYIWESTGYALTYHDWHTDGPWTGRFGVYFYHVNGQLKWNAGSLPSSLYALCEQND